MKKHFNFNGGWSSGDACRHIGKKNSTKVRESKKVYSRKKVNKKDFYS